MSLQPVAVLLDFDGTITMSDIGDLIVRTFGRDGWRTAEAAYKRGEITLRELWSAETAHFREDDHDEMRRTAARIAEIRPGFPEFVSHCRSSDIPVEIASSGIRFYIDAVLEKTGVADMLVAAPDVEYDERGHGLLTFRNDVSDCDETAMCKCERVWRQKRQGRRVVFVGDGATDYCAASQADHVLARDRLADYCEREGLGFTPFKDFFEVQEIVTRLRGG